MSSVPPRMDAPEPTRGSSPIVEYGDAIGALVYALGTLLDELSKSGNLDGEAYASRLQALIDSSHGGKRPPGGLADLILKTMVSAAGPKEKDDA